MQITDLLKASNLERTDAEVLLAATLGTSRTWLHAHGNDETSPANEKIFMEWAERRKAGEPVAYCIGEREFYGRTFHVEPGVLIPRPCTEELIVDALAFLDGQRNASIRTIDEGIVSWVQPLSLFEKISTVVDIGTGSGCIAITIACERPEMTVIATDVSDAALAIAEKNTAMHGVSDRVIVRPGPGLDPVMDLRKPFVIISNPPYVADDALLSADVRAFEPSIALMGGGVDGGDIVRTIVTEAKKHPYCVGFVLECLAAQASIV